MPLRRRFRRKRLGRAPIKRRRLYARKKRFLPRKNGRATTAILRNPSGIPDRTFVKLRYTQLFLFNGVGTQDQVFSLNAPFDPDFTGAGGQPYFYDQWSTFYTYQSTHGSRIKVRMFPTGNTALTFTTKLALIPSQSGASFSAGAFDLALEQPYAKMIAVQGNGSVQKNTISNYMSATKIWGAPKASVNINDANYGSLVGAVPNTRSYWHLVHSAFDEASTAPSMFHVQITYYITFSGRARPARS